MIAELVVLTVRLVPGGKAPPRGDPIGRGMGAGLARWRALASGSAAGSL
jgi:hypothetical protein